jgi:hypothetical protein
MQIPAGGGIQIPAGAGVQIPAVGGMKISAGAGVQMPAGGTCSDDIFADPETFRPFALLVDAGMRGVRAACVECELAIHTDLGNRLGELGWRCVPEKKIGGGVSAGGGMVVRA